MRRKRSFKDSGAHRHGYNHAGTEHVKAGQRLQTPTSSPWKEEAYRDEDTLHISQVLERLPTVELVVDHVLQPLQPLQDGLPVRQVGNFAISGSQPLVGDAPDLDQLLGSVLDPAVDREQDNPHEHQDVDGQQSFDFACHSHERRLGSGLPSSPAAARWPGSRSVVRVGSERRSTPRRS